jgi:hypothetical protein
MVGNQFMAKLRALFQFPTNDGFRSVAYCSIAASINEATITKPTAVATTVKGSIICDLPIGRNPPNRSETKSPAGSTDGANIPTREHARAVSLGYQVSRGKRRM